VAAPPKTVAYNGKNMPLNTEIQLIHVFDCVHYIITFQMNVVLDRKSDAFVLNSTCFALVYNDYSSSTPFLWQSTAQRSLRSIQNRTDSRDISHGDWPQASDTP